jgi:hypothetical protein
MFSKVQFAENADSRWASATEDEDLVTCPVCVGCEAHLLSEGEIFSWLMRSGRRHITFMLRSSLYSGAR